MSQINTLIKPTNNCNLRCKYCFHEKYGYNNKLLEMDILKKYIILLSEKYKHINIIWHGGEPLTVPMTYYEEIYDFCSNIDATFTYSLQTNGTLLNQEKIDFFRKNETNIGLSFDGLGNEFMRTSTDKILKNIELLKQNGFYPGAIIVINQNNVNKLIEEYNYFKSLDLGMKLNPMFNDGAVIKNKFLYLNPNEYISNFINFFKYWVNDKECNINVLTCEEIVNLIVHESSRVCTFNSCLGKWLCLDSNGTLYPCDRLCLEDYNLGDVSKINSIEEIFYNSNFFKLLQGSIIRRNNCINSCEFYKNCYSGCNANAILEGNLEYRSSCIQKEILKEIKEFIFTTKLNLENMNSNYSKILRR